MAFLLAILSVCYFLLQRSGLAWQRLADWHYSRYQVRAWRVDKLRSRKVAEDYLRVPTVLHHVCLRRQVFHVSARILTLPNFFPHNAPDSMPFVDPALSSLLFYQRIFPIPQFKKPLLITHLVVMAFMVSFFFVTVFQW